MNTIFFQNFANKRLLKNFLKIHNPLFFINLNLTKILINFKFITILLKLNSKKSFQNFTVYLKSFKDINFVFF